MLNKKTFLAIIPARGGSKRLPRKNILNLSGKPLITWTIEAALNSKYIDKVIVTSDDDDILDIARQSGSDIIKRPDALASDTATSYDAIKHTIDNVERYDYIILLQATSPLRNSKHIDAALDLLEAKGADAIISVTEMDHSPLWSNILPDDGNMSDFIRDELKNTRSQDLEKYYRLNGAIYICQTELLLIQKTFFIKDNIFSFVMNKESSIDIDEYVDFELVKLIINDKTIN